MKTLSKLERLLRDHADVVGLVQHDGFRTVEPLQQTKPPTYFHVLYEPYPYQLRSTEKTLGQPLPPLYRSFLKICNGGKFYTGSHNIGHLSLSGVWPDGFTPNNTSRGLPSSNLLTDNQMSRPIGMPAGDFRIGHYAWDGSYVCLTAAGVPYVRLREQHEIVAEWSDFDSFLFSELLRLKGHFNSQLIQIDLTRSTSLVPDN